MNKTLFLFLFLLHSSNCFAEFKWFELSIGAGVSVNENNRLNNQAKYFKGKHSIEPRPFLLFRLGPIAFSSEGAGMAVLYFQNVKLMGAVIYEGEPYLTNGMFERRRSIFAGGVMQIYSLLFQAFQDVQGRSNGRIFKITSKPEFRFTDKWVFSPRIYFQYWDDKYVNYYYGVGEFEENLDVGRSKYVGKESYNYGFMLRNIFKIGSLKYLFSVGMKYYGQGVYSSPTVTDKKEARLNFGLIYDVF